VVAVCALGAPAPASADFTALLATCAARDARDADTGNGNTLPFRFCDDGVPDFGGTTPNLTGAKGVKVPGSYAGAVGLPAKSGTVPGADLTGDITIDANISLPDPAANPMPAGGYPLVVMMHGCCSGSKAGWEATTIDGGGSENWHYNNAWFASRGYVVLTYTSRGFVNGDEHGSTGETQLDSNRFEINDYQHMAGQLADLTDIDTTTAGNQTVNGEKVVPTGGSYGGGFTWMALTDPTWKSPGNKDMEVVAAAPKYGWTNLVEALVPRGDDMRDALPTTDPVARAALPSGFPKRTINNALYLSGKLGFPTVNGPHNTFPADVDAAQACLASSDPYEQNPLCTTTFSTALPRFINERSAYFQTAFFTGLANSTIDPVPVFSAGTTTDKLFPAAEHRRMVERLKATVAGYPVQEYYGDYNHFVQNKRKEWSDLCGADHHACAYGDYPGADPKDLDAEPANQVREDGVTTRLNRFIDHYAQPPANPSQGAPDLDVTASLQTCPDNVAPGFPLDEPGQRFTAPDFASLAPNRLNVNVTGSQPTTSALAPNEHAAKADPVANTASNSSRCVVENAPGGLASAGPGVATYDSDALPGEFIMLGQTRLTVQHTGAGAGLQLNARLYDLYPDGRQVLVDRGVRRLANANGPTVIDLHGAGWRFPAGHRLRLELTQDDDPYIKSSVQPGSLVIAGLSMSVPVRGAGGPTTIGGRVPAQPSSASGAAKLGPLRAGFGRIRGAIGVRRGSFRIRCRATGAQRRTCRVAARAVLRRGRTRRIGSGRATLPAGRRGVLVRVRLNRLGRRLLARNRSRRGMKVRLDLRVAEPLTNRTAVKRKRYRMRIARR
jgi:dienelactone hydrolase